ncbi:MAG: methyltransferase domain-containing protein [Bryobacteraceae bacterium]
MRARNSAVTEATLRQVGELDRLGYYHSFRLPDGTTIDGFQTLEQQELRLSQFPIPADLSGRRVLDIGAWDGWFSFEMERRGASVVAFDSTHRQTLVAMRERLGSSVEYVIGDICKFDSRELGRFDIVLFLGVLYHLKHPLLALEHVCDLCIGLTCVESFVTDDGSNVTDSVPAMEFYETSQLCGQFDNWFGPNCSCLLALCRTAGFARVELGRVLDNRAHVSCHRHWIPAGSSRPGPYITCVENSVLLDRSFSHSRDDYVSIWFKSTEANISQDVLFPEVGPYGARPVHVRSTGGDGWQVVVKLPPGLDRGWYDVRLRTATTGWSNFVRIGIDDPEKEITARNDSFLPSTFQIEIVTDGKSWERNLIHTGAGSCISVWVSGLPFEVLLRDASIRLNEAGVPASFVSEVDMNGYRQINAFLPAGMASGKYDVIVVYMDRQTPPARVHLVP